MEAKPQPRLVSLGDGAPAYLPILQGPPDSVTMRSGMIALSPGSSVGVHSTEGFEELLVVLEGRGEVRITGQEPLAIDPGVVAYCPPRTEHDVMNTGSGLLRYIFVVASATP